MWLAAPFLADSEQSMGCLLRLRLLEKQRAALFNIPQRQLRMSYICCWKAKEPNEWNNHIFFSIWIMKTIAQFIQNQLCMNSQKLCTLYPFCTSGFLKDAAEFNSQPFNQRMDCCTQCISVTLDTIPEERFVFFITCNEFIFNFKLQTS